jgi:NAD(P)-dependent dehydrogenase (short-subunit alcohol dehydrogenase family)
MEASRKGQAAIVTGAGQGIGRAVALRLAADGMHVTVVDMHAGRAEGVAAEIAASGGRALALAADVTAAADRQRMIDATLA